MNCRYDKFLQRLLLICLPPHSEPFEATLRAGSVLEAIADVTTDEPLQSFCEITALGCRNGKVQRIAERLHADLLADVRQMEETP